MALASFLSIQFAFIDNADGLPFAVDNGFWLYQANVGMDASIAFSAPSLFSVAETCDNVSEEELRRHFHLYFQGIAIIDAVHQDLIICGKAPYSTTPFRSGREDTLTPRIISISSLRPIGFDILICVLHREHFLRVSTQISRVR